MVYVTILEKYRGSPNENLAGVMNFPVIEHPPEYMKRIVRLPHLPAVGDVLTLMDCAQEMDHSRIVGSVDGRTVTLMDSKTQERYHPHTDFVEYVITQRGMISWPGTTSSLETIRVHRKKESA